MRQKKSLKLLNIIVTFFMFTALLLTMFLVVNSKLSEGNNSIFGYQLKTVLSGSMEPDIKTGSVIFVKTGGEMTRFNEGDVITFFIDENVLVTHRIEKVESAGQVYITKGDANDGIDIEPVTADNIIGAYTGVTIPYIGYVMGFANTKEGAALLLILPGVFLLVYAFITIWQTARTLDQIKKQIGTKID